MSEKQIKALVERFAEAAVEKKAQSLVTRKSARDIVTELSGQGKVPPAEVESEIAVLTALATDRAVHKFSEGGQTVERTLYDQKVAGLRARRSTFAERFADPVGAAAEGDAELEKLKAKFHRFSERGDLPDGATWETWAEGFKANKKADPRLTADEYLPG